MQKSTSLHQILEIKNQNPTFSKDTDSKIETEKLQLRMLRIQQGIWHKKCRAIIVFEGFDAAGKGGAIRQLTKMLDPRGFNVHPIGPPTPEEHEKPWLHRFWIRLPKPGTIAIFDRSWYGRVLVERVEGLASKKQWKKAYSEINQFELLLQNDGIEIIKIFLAVTKREQLTRFKERLKDPYKQWKISEDDIRARKKWNQYVDAIDEMILRTHLRTSPWSLIPADNKFFSRKKTLSIVTSKLKSHEKWMEKNAAKIGKRSLGAELKSLGIKIKGRDR